MQPDAVAAGEFREIGQQAFLVLSSGSHDWEHGVAQRAGSPPKSGLGDLNQRWQPGALLAPIN
jgi:hypothetical protein